MKQLLTFNPAFTPGTPGNGTLDFSNYPGFDFGRLYAIVNVTRGTPIFIPGTTAYSASISSVNPAKLTFTLDTSSHSTTDVINIYYESAAGLFIGARGSIEDTNSVFEQGGQLELLQEKMDKILVELKLQTEILLQGFIGLPLTQEDSRSLRNDIDNPQNIDNILSQQ